MLEGCLIGYLRLGAGTLVQCSGYSGTMQRVQWHNAAGTVVPWCGARGDKGGTVVLG